MKEVATGSATATHRYSGRTAVVATKHGKERILARPIKIGLGLSIACSVDIDTDQLGTFTGEVERTGTPGEAALRKARLGIAMTGMQLGLASEGSFGPHPALPFLAVDHELVAFVDNDLGIEIVESVVSTRTNFGQTTTKSVTELERFLNSIDFPSHAVIIRPAGQSKTGPLYKGLTDWHQLTSAVAACSAVSEIHLASVETDMRAHCNPTRRAVIRKAAFKLVRRLLRTCPNCDSPGWGIVGHEPGLPCRWCGMPTSLFKYEIYGCVHCDRRVSSVRSDGCLEADEAQCSNCNP